MSVELVDNNYGKSRVRLIKVSRRGEWHELQNINVKIAFEGDFDDIHLEGDNSKCLPTDTMKNTVYALAAQTERIEEIETFGLRLAGDTSVCDAARFLAAVRDNNNYRDFASGYGWETPSAR